MTWLAALLLKPFVAGVLIVCAWLVSRLIWRYMPDSPLKRKLFSPLPAYRQGRRDRT